MDSREKERRLDLWKRTHPDLVLKLFIMDGISQWKLRIGILTGSILSSSILIASPLIEQFPQRGYVALAVALAGLGINQLQRHIAQKSRSLKSNVNAQIGIT